MPLLNQIHEETEEGSPAPDTGEGHVYCMQRALAPDTGKNRTVFDMH